jgi:4-carboxymuconolactone decarboxylase
MTPEELALGRQVRREVLGEGHIKESAGGGDPMMKAKTTLSEYVWARIWARPGLSRDRRSIINLALLTALNRPHELKLHLNSALNNGLSPEEIMEVLLQCGAYCGIAAAKDSFRIMHEVFHERGIPTSGDAA